MSLAAALVVIASACAGSAPAPTPAPTPIPTVQTFGQLADAGKTVYASRCSRCHGDQGQGATGPAVAGANANLGKYNTAQGLLDYVSKTMPMNAPGSLSRQEYTQVLSFLLVQDQFIPAGTAFDQSKLGQVQLKK